MYHADVAQLVERDLAKVEVAGSSPVVRSSSGAIVAILIHFRAHENQLEGATKNLRFLSSSSVTA
jgi:hypothetical protein